MALWSLYNIQLNERCAHFWVVRNHFLMSKAVHWYTILPCRNPYPVNSWTRKCFNIFS